MKKDLTFYQRLKEAGATDDMIALYQTYLTSANKKGQERLLCRCRRIESEKLRKDREKLSRLDFCIARVEKTQDLFENNDSCK